MHGNYKIMSNIENKQGTEIEETSKDFTKNWVSSSKFVFYLSLFCILSLIFGSCFRLYQHSYKGHPDVEIQGSTKYTPEYK